MLAVPTAIAVLFFQEAEWLEGALALTLLAPLYAFYSDKSRSVQCRPRGVLAPLDGWVLHRRECHDPILGREAIRIVLRVTRFGGYCVRAPVEGTVVAVPDGSLSGVSCIRTDEGEAVVLRARSWFFWWKPVLARIGERLGQGRRCGLRRLTREIEVLVPAAARVEVEVGQKVRSGQTVLATLLRKA